MERNPQIVSQIEKIRYVFQHALYIVTEQDELAIQEYLQNSDPEFRAVAYEGVAMGFALKDLPAGTLQLWRSFMRTAKVSYLPHIYIGLGWALAKQKIPSLIFLDGLDPLMLFRVLDGFGYYDGTFKQIKTINNKERSACIEPKDYMAYDQGVGRSIWYHAKGEIEKVSYMVKTFSEDRHTDLWRGIGVASTFVGGIDEATFRDLWHNAGNHQSQLAVGAAFAARARVQTNSMTSAVESACRVWCNRPAQQVMLLTITAEPSSALNPYNAYMTWIAQIESKLNEALKPIEFD
jgi:hypothetical protein